MGFPGDGGLMGTIGQWTEDRLNNWMAQRFNLQGNVRALIGRAVTTAITNTVVPPGVGAYTYGTAAPIGWLAADGSVLAQADYPQLFAAIGTTWNTGGEAFNEFRLPDPQGRALIGSGTGSGLTARAVGDRVGEEEHLLSEPELTPHQHLEATSGTPPGVPLSDGDFVSVSAALSGSGTNVVTMVGGTFVATQLATDATGGGSPHNNMQPSLALLAIIKT